MRTVVSAAVAGLLCVVAAGGVAQADTGQPGGRQTPVGTWSAKVILGGDPNTEDHAVISYTRTGKVCLTTAISAGDGLWWTEGGAAFGWADKEVFIPNPGFPGYVLILQEGTLAGDTYTSSGESQVFDQQGKWVKSITADLTAVRTSSEPEATCK
ncbi:hypothetical protein GCM10029964_055310 [Kibdelosporangium lantanae]